MARPRRCPRSRATPRCSGGSPSRQVTSKGYFPAFLDFQENRSTRRHLPDVPQLGTADPQHDHRPHPRPREESAPPPMLYSRSTRSWTARAATASRGRTSRRRLRHATSTRGPRELLHTGGPPDVRRLPPRDGERGGRTPPGSGSPEDFIAAYWYFRRRIEVVGGVPNLVWVITYMHNTFAPYLKHGGPDRWWPARSPYADVPDDHLVGVDIYNRNMCHDKEWRTFHRPGGPHAGPRKQPFTAYRFALGEGPQDLHRRVRLRRGRRMRRHAAARDR